VYILIPEKWAAGASDVIIAVARWSSSYRVEIPTVSREGRIFFQPVLIRVRCVVIMMALEIALTHKANGPFNGDGGAKENI
jgi:hypothetical protein